MIIFVVRPAEMCSSEHSTSCTFRFYVSWAGLTGSIKSPRTTDGYCKSVSHFPVEKIRCSLIWMLDEKNLCLPLCAMISSASYWTISGLAFMGSVRSSSMSSGSQQCFQHSHTPILYLSLYASTLPFLFIHSLHQTIRVDIKPWRTWRDGFKSNFPFRKCNVMLQN